MDGTFQMGQIKQQALSSGPHGAAVRSRWEEYQMCEVQVTGNRIPAAESLCVMRCGRRCWQGKATPSHLSAEGPAAQPKPVPTGLPLAASSQ